MNVRTVCHLSHQYRIPPAPNAKSHILVSLELSIRVDRCPSNCRCFQRQIVVEIWSYLNDMERDITDSDTLPASVQRAKARYLDMATDPEQTEHQGQH